MRQSAATIPGRRDTLRGRSIRRRQDMVMKGRYDRTVETDAA